MVLPVVVQCGDAKPMTLAFVLVVVAAVVLAVDGACCGDQRVVGHTSLYVNPVSGSDSNAGTDPQHAFKTVTHARDVAASLITKGSVTVHLASGDYSLVSAPLALNATHTSANGNLLSFKALNGASPRFTAGVVIPPNAIETGAVSAARSSPYKSKIRTVNLTSLGITDYGNILCNTGLGNCPASKAGRDSRMEVFVNGQPLVLARYPNINASSGYWQWNNIQKVVDEKTGFTYAGDRPKAWEKESDHLWLWGYWSFDWADSVVKVSKIDAKSNAFVISNSTPPTYGFKENARWLAFNLLAELDAPGEFFVDRSTGLLHFIPPGDGALPAGMEVAVSVGGNVVEMHGARNVLFEGVSFQYGRGNGIMGSELTNVTVSNSTISCFGGHGVQLEGDHNALTNSVVSHAGCKGVVVSGGSTHTLRPGNGTVNGVRISNFARHTRTYNPGLSWSGVGHHFAANTISNAPHAAILGGGNDCMFEGNTIKDVAFEVDDAGAFYSGRNWVTRGNVIRFNHFESIRTRVPVFLGSPSVQAIYFDDQLSGYEVYNNTFFDCQVGVFIGGGRSHHVKFNHFAQCDTAVHVDSRGLSWQKTDCSAGGMFEQQLEAFNYQQPPYAQRYPVLPNIMHEMPCYPVYNQITDNTALSCKQFLDFDVSKLLAWRNVVADNKQRNDTAAVVPAPEQQHQRQLSSSFASSSSPSSSSSSSSSAQLTQQQMDAVMREMEHWWVRPASYTPLH